MTNTDIYLSNRRYYDAKFDGFFKTYRRAGWVVGTNVDIYEASQNDIGMCGTVVEVTADEALVEVW